MSVVYFFSTGFSQDSWVQVKKLELVQSGRSSGLIIESFNCTNTKVEIKSLGLVFLESVQDFEVGLIITMLNLTLIRQRPKF
jgi:hypothetical protein